MVALLRLKVQQFQTNTIKTTMKTDIPSWLKPHVVTEETFTFEGVEYTYAVVKSQFGTSQGVPGMFTIMNGGVLAVSDIYPVEYRELGLIHEIVENGKCAHEGEHACVESLKVELDLARQKPGIVIHEYICFRIGFFAGMTAYYEGKTRTDEEDALLAKMRYSLGHLIKANG